MGHTSKQAGFWKSPWIHRYAHGGDLRRRRNGRNARPLSTKDSIHLVFKADRNHLRYRSLRELRAYVLITATVKQYAKRFHVSIHSMSIQGDHIHLLVRAPRRSMFQAFFRVVAGQIAQRMANADLTKARAQSPAATVTDTPTAIATPTLRVTRLWLHRPFTRVVRGGRAFKTVINYIQLNEQEARGRHAVPDKPTSRSDS